MARAEDLLQFARVDLCTLEEEDKLGRYVDDIKGTEMDPVLTRKARREELDEFERCKVYEVIPRKDLPAGAKVVGVRWVETDKGKQGEVKIRSRLVAQ